MTPVEKVGAAIEAARRNFFFDECPDRQVVADAMARAAIEALASNVSDGMVNAAWIENQGHAATDSTTNDVIRAEIIAALRSLL